MLALAVAVWAQSASQKPSVDVRRVGHRIACQCGCVDTVATCAMLECHFSKPAKEKIAKLQAAGVSDQAIIDQFIAEYGRSIYRGEPNAMGWIVPYASLLFGLIMVVWVVKRYLRPRQAAAPTAALDPLSERYSQQIERDLSQLD